MLVLLPVLLAWAGEAGACRCAPATAGSAYRDADAIVLARVASRRDSGVAQRTYRLIVGESWKRTLSGPLTIKVDRDACMPDLVSGSPYLLYLNDGPGDGYETSVCSGNLAAGQAVSRIVDLRRNRRHRPR